MHQEMEFMIQKQQNKKTKKKKKHASYATIKSLFHARVTSKR
jgi:hypothetical protein